MDFKEAIELEELRHKNKMIELCKEEANIKLKYDHDMELSRVESAEKRRIEELKFELRMKAEKKK